MSFPYWEHSSEYTAINNCRECTLYNVSSSSFVFYSVLIMYVISLGTRCIYFITSLFATFKQRLEQIFITRQLEHFILTFRVSFLHQNINFIGVTVSAFSPHHWGLNLGSAHQLGNQGNHHEPQHSGFCIPPPSAVMGKFEMML